MPTIPPIKATTKLYTSVGIINSILSDETIIELQGIPKAEATTESIRMIGQEITSFAPRCNAFKAALINRIGMMRIHYMLFTNPWAWAKQGKLEMGETIEQIWIGLAEAFPYDPVASETNFVKQAKQEVLSAFHSVNYQEVYKVTINEYQLQRAFLSLEGLRDFVEDLIGAISRSVSYDEFSLMKYLIAVLMLEGKIPTISIPQITRENASDAITTVTGVTNAFQFPSAKYTMAGNINTTPIDDLYIIETTNSNAYIKVNALAVAYNVDYVKFNGHVVMVDSFGTFDWKRMDMIFAKDPGYRRFTTEEINLLETIQLIAMDKQFMQIYDSIEFMGTPFINGEGAYTNYPYHVSKVASASPFHNCVAFVVGEGVVNSVTVTPATASVYKGNNLPLQAVVSTSGFVKTDIIWEISTTVTDSSIGQDGILRVGLNETASTITVVATSVADETKTASAEITVSANAFA